MTTKLKSLDQYQEVREAYNRAKTNLTLVKPYADLLGKYLNIINANPDGRSLLEAEIGSENFVKFMDKLREYFPVRRDKNGKPVLDLTPLENTAVNTQKQKEFLDLMRVYECGGWRWTNDDSPTRFNFWLYFREKTCVDAGFVEGAYWKAPKKFEYSSKDHFQDLGHKIISPQEFYDAQNPRINSKMILEINDWFEKHKIW